MVWDNLLYKQVKVVQKDNFIKYGILESADDDFIVLKFHNGEPAIIAKDFILSITPVRDYRG